MEEKTCHFPNPIVFHNTTIPIRRCVCSLDKFYIFTCILVSLLFNIHIDWRRLVICDVQFCLYGCTQLIHPTHDGDFVQIVCVNLIFCSKELGMANDNPDDLKNGKRPASSTNQDERMDIDELIQENGKHYHENDGQLRDVFI